MKKLKCESCGGDIEVDGNKEFATCPFCQTKYQLNEKKEIYIRMDEDIKKAALGAFNRSQKVGKVIGIVFAIIFLFTAGFIGYNFYQQTSGTSSFDIKRFNSKFEFYKGTKDSTSVSRLLDEVVTNNKTNKRKITVVFGDVKTDDPDQIVKIKKDLKDMLSAEYEVGIDYDDKGFAEKVTIEEEISQIKKMYDEYQEKASSDE